MQKDISKLELAIVLMGEVNSTLTEAFFNHVHDTGLPAKTDVSAASAPLKLARSISDVRLVKDALSKIKESV